MSRGRRELLSKACAVCGQPVKGGQGRIHPTLPEMYTVHSDECEGRFEAAVAEAVARLRAGGRAQPRLDLTLPLEESPTPCARSGGR